MPKVSIVMPTYNQEKYLIIAIRSILGQTMKDFELIIVNDGSTDSTSEILSKITDPRVMVIHQENKGASVAMNRGFSAAAGDYFTWLASDNLYERQFLEKASRFLDSNQDIDLVYTSFQNINDKGEFIDYVFLEPYYPGLLMVNPGAVGVVFLYRKKIYEMVGVYNDLVCNDLDYWLRVSRNSGFGFIPEVLGCNRKHSEMRTVKERDSIVQEVKELLKKEINNSAVNPEPCLIDYFSQLSKKTLEVLRALQCRLRNYNKNSTLIIVGDNCLMRDMIVTILKNDGYDAKGMETGEIQKRVDEGNIYIPLDNDTGQKLRDRFKNVVPLGSQYSSMFGKDF